MSNEGFFQLGLMDVSGRPVNESKVKVGFVRVADEPDDPLGDDSRPSAQGCAEKSSDVKVKGGKPLGYELM
jgi:hypothetical protein